MSSIRFPKRLQVDSIGIPLRWMLVVPFVLLTAGATALVGYLSYQRGQQAVENLANQLLEQTSARVGDRLSNYLQAPQQVVAANQLAVKQGILDVNNREQLRQQFWQQMILNPSVPAIGFWREGGSGLSYGRLISKEEAAFASKVTGKPISLRTLYFANHRSDQRQYYLLDPQGKPQQFAYTAKGDFRNLDWYQPAKTVGEQHWTPISINKTIPVLQILAVAPAYDQTGIFQGLFASTYLLAEFSTFLNHLHFSPTGTVFILDRSGNLVATSDLSEASATRQVNGKPDRIPAIESQEPQIRDVSRQLLQQYGSFPTIKSSKQLNLMVQGNRQFVQVMPYQEQYGLDWLVIMVVPESDFMAEIQAQNSWTFLLCCGTLIATSALGLLAARRITEPLHRLNLAAHQIAQNHFEHEVPVSGLGEVKQLSQAFRQMAEQLRLSFQLRTDYEQELKQQVAERTAELVQVKDLREAIFNESTDAIFLVESPPTTRILDCNQRAVDLFEAKSKSELIGIQGSTLQKQPYTEDELAEIAAELKQKGFWSREIEYVTKTGKSFWGNLAAKPISIAGQAMQLVRLTDISDRKQLEGALQKSEAKTRDILNSTIAAIASMQVFQDGSWTINQVSAGCEMICGYTSEALTQDQQLWVSLIVPEDWEANAPQVFVNIFAGRTHTYEYRIHHKDGRLRWISQTNNTYWDEEQQCWNVTAISVDITERKQIEESLRESEERFRQAFDNAAIGIALVATDGHFLKVNRSLCEMLGYSEAELLERSFHDITDPTDLDADLELVRQVLASERRTYQLEKRYLHKRGTVVWALLCVSLVRDSSGKPLYFVSQMQDISDRHRLDVIKDEFISIVSHELRTPLTSIHGSIRILESGVLSDEPETAQRMLHVALRSSDRLVRLVNDILDLERLESGKVALVQEACEVSDLMEQAIDLVQVLADQAHVLLDWTPLSATVQAAPDAIVQALTNLLSNAIKFSPAGGTVWLKAALQEAEELPSAEGKALDHQARSCFPTLLFSITDQGRGIPLENLESIFERFQQVDSSDSRQKGGTGLGLAICKSIVQQHSGQIWVESVVGQGSTFYFTLPIVERKRE